jgi:methionine sulfoxide reductase catalytic subunit
VVIEEEDMTDLGDPIPSSEITPEHLYLSRREFMRLAGVVVGGSILAACIPVDQPRQASVTLAAGQTATPTPAGLVSELGEPLTSLKDITNYNNYYEFTTDKEGVAGLSKDFKTSPWSVQVGGMVNKPQTFTIEELLKRYPREERVYRLRCVEGWSMVIPWLGFPLNKLLKDVEPTSSAKFVRFVTISAPDQMPGMRDPMFPWPYQEGLRLDEAMHDLTLLASGLYGKELPPQDGAPLRLVVPWKYGFKSIKAIVRIELVDTMPATMWSTIAPDEYGFYSNVNPEVPHPRWSQASERRIGQSKRIPTLKFNGYAAQVAHLYDGMDLAKNY